MEDRIEINGVWYVREKQDKTPDDMLDDSPTGYHGLVIENEDVHFELSILMNDDYKTLNYKMGPALVVTFKDGERKNWIEEYWDNPSFLVDVFYDPKLALEETPRFEPKDLLMLKSILGRGIESGWFQEYE